MTAIPPGIPLDASIRGAPATTPPGQARTGSLFDLLLCSLGATPVAESLPAAMPPKDAGPATGVDARPTVKGSDEALDSAVDAEATGVSTGTDALASLLGSALAAPELAAAEPDDRAEGTRTETREMAGPRAERTRSGAASRVPAHPPAPLASLAHAREIGAFASEMDAYGERSQQPAAERTEPAAERSLDASRADSNRAHPSRADSARVEASAPARDAGPVQPSPLPAAPLAGAPLSERNVSAEPGALQLPEPPAAHRAAGAAHPGEARAVPELPHRNEGEILRSAQLLLREGGGQARIQLVPPQLGELELRVTLHDQAVHVSLTSDRAAVADLLTRHLGDLRQALQLGELQVDRIDVNFRGGDDLPGSRGEWDLRDERGEGDSGRRLEPLPADDGRGPDASGRWLRLSPGALWAVDVHV